MKRITYHDECADNLGRRFFSLDWEDRNGIFRPELAKDGKPVGLRRGQCFFCDPARFAAEVDL
jgi:hypothetical protein